ncbi:hypothetical protein SAMN05216303_106281 [Rhodoferax sp. OV413]|uniref:hypothetical protein n=1 Tax=Rhodoferax sp. OV413 TaxID=1855285 RepID=UPI000881939A|nr:hypothetical protein [Rhodoferax sp. OV413]SDP72566.1 hypothetical protein SAMN05216303_106281 [Rhodoferax sp. OV413]
MLLTTRRTAALALCLAANLCLAQAVAPPAVSVRVRGTVQSVAPGLLTVKDRSGEVVQLVLPDALPVSEIYPMAMSDIQPGSFIGTAAMPQPDGSERAIAVMVFPESARGAGEGHRPFDMLPQSTMTNATVADVVATPKGRTMQLKYKDGARDIVVPLDAPVVSFKPGDRSLLVPGASVSLTAQMVGDKPTISRISAGRNGFALPY